ncbi:hypothetical protein [Hyalangium rubrum]|uniref:Type II toxin-antitoxin system RelE/ParE family toxin n=1 Tax=Hyalangium rubrum TaxID=3103134 RepID=A0ABU5H960_9BACT|nr:hypothetical protein [Hyalangium sp. s54d21]MDY7230027.1 hypothetical protein [Hyalangium sp. s54d21]
MAFRLQLTPDAVRVLSTCRAAVREQVLHELGDVFAGPLLSLEARGPGPEASGTRLLPSGFHVRYALDVKRGLLLLLELQEPEGQGMPAPTS